MYTLRGLFQIDMALNDYSWNENIHRLDNQKEYDESYYHIIGLV